MVGRGGEPHRCRFALVTVFADRRDVYQARLRKRIDIALTSLTECVAAGEDRHRDHQDRAGTEQTKSSPHKVPHPPDVESVAEKTASDEYFAKEQHDRKR